MRFTKLYAATVVGGMIGVIAGVFVGGPISAGARQDGLGWLGPAFLWVVLGFILVESCAMSLAVHIANHGRGNLRSTFLPTVVLAVPIPLLLPGFMTVLALPLFLFQAWVCVKVQLATAAGRTARRRA